MIRLPLQVEGQAVACVEIHIQLLELCWSVLMAKGPKLLYIIVQDASIKENVRKGIEEINESTNKGRMMPLSLNIECAVTGAKTPCSSFRYTQPVLQSTLQLIGCKARHAFKISKRVFDILRDENPVNDSEQSGSASQVVGRHDLSRHLSDSELDSNRDYTHEEIKRAAEENEIQLKEITKKLFTAQQRRSTVVLTRMDFMDVVCDAMSEYRYVGPNQRSDFALACRIREKKASMTVLLCGTSGCGKSTLSTLLASRLGITTVVSTDSIRHMMRSFADEKQNPLLWASTYSAGEHLDPMAVAEAKAKKKAKKMARVSIDSQLDALQASVASAKENVPSQSDLDFNRLERENKGKTPLLNEVLEGGVSAKTMAVQGYKAQSEMVIDSLDRLITSWEQKCESVIIEGVHLSLNFVMGLMKKHPSIIPFMVYIANEEKHLERFAVRAKYMTLDPAKNKYVKYIRNIRAIQEYQCKRADKHLVPKVNNTNMDKSVACIHATIFACLRRREAGESFYDRATNTVKVVDEEYRNQCAANSLSSKGMLQVLRRKGSSGQFMALVNTDGSVAKTWAFPATDAARAPSNRDTDKGHSSSLLRYGVEVSPVNLQFGSFGLSAWPNDIVESSCNGSIDDVSSRGDGADNQSSRLSSQYDSSCSSSPRLGEGTEKMLVNEDAVPGSDEEQEEEALDVDSEEELTDGRKEWLEEELEGSVDDQSIGSEDDSADECAEADQDGPDQGGRSCDAKRLDSLDGTNRNFCKAGTQAESNSENQSHRESGFFKGGALSQPDRLKVQSNSFNSNTQSASKEANAKHLHGRSKSLPLFGNYSTCWDNPLVFEVVKRV